MNNGNKRRGVPLIFGVAVIMLVIGVALGSVVFPMTKTETTLQLSTVTTTTSTTVTTASSSPSYPNLVYTTGAESFRILSQRILLSERQYHEFER